MEHALFLTNNSARRVMGKVPWFKGRSIKTVPHYKRGAFEGYKVLLNGKPLTERAVEILQKGSAYG